MESKKLLLEIIAKHAIGMHLTVDLPPVLNLEGRLFHTPLKIVDQDDAKNIAFQLMDEKHKVIFANDNAVSFTYDAQEAGRYRISIYRQKGLVAAVIRAIPKELPNLGELNLPPKIEEFVNFRRGLVLVTGPSGSGKSTTLAALINLINERRKWHIITLEDPIEYLHDFKKCMISQREIGEDTRDFPTALREALRQDPDVILVGDMRDLETMSIALTAAETGHLVFGSMHTIDAVQSIDRIVDVFPSHHQSQVRTQLALTLQAVVAQQLIFRADGQGRVPVTEIMAVTPAIRAMIRDGRSQQIYSVIETGGKFGMQSFDQCLQDLLKDKVISDAEAITQAVKPYKLIKNIAAATAFIPRDPSEVRVVDAGSEIVTIDRKEIVYKADFTPGYEGYWTSSGIINFNEDGLLCVKNPLNPARRIYASDFNIVSNRKKPFPLNKHITIKYRTETDPAAPAISDEEKVLYFKIYSPPLKGKAASYEKTIFKMPLQADNNWHNLIIDIPPIYVGNIVKIYMVDFPNLLKSFSISDILFF